MSIKSYSLAALATLVQAGTALVDVSHVQCNPNIKTLETPTFGKGDFWFPAAFTVCAEATINGTLNEVYDALLDFKSYGSWNSFVVNVGVPADVTNTPSQVYVGMPITLTTRGLLPIINSTTNQVMSLVEAPNSKTKDYSIAAWTTDYGWAGLKAEHANIIRKQEDGTALYISWETYYGPLSYLVGALLKDPLQKQFEKQGEDLRVYVEKS